jgi:hypothetical protein
VLLHGSEVQYLFDVRASVPAPVLTAPQLQLADAMQQYWTQPTVEAFNF